MAESSRAHRTESVSEWWVVHGRWQCVAQCGTRNSETSLSVSLCSSEVMTDRHVLKNGDCPYWGKWGRCPKHTRTSSIL